VWMQTLVRSRSPAKANNEQGTQAAQQLSLRLVALDCRKREVKDH